MAESEVYDSDYSDDSQELSRVDNSKSEAATQTYDVDLRPLNPDFKPDLNKGLRIPFETLMSFGTALASLPPQFRTITQTMDIPVNNLLTATDKFGNPLNINILSRFNDGTGILGSWRDANNNFHQARLHQADSVISNVKTTVPYDPTLMFMAAALMQIEQKLDKIQEVQERMFSYLVQKDEAELRGDLQTLRDVLDNYKYNWENSTYKKNKHNLVQEIRRSSESRIVFHKKQLVGAFGNQGPFHFDQDVRNKLDETLDKVKEYQVSLYLYAFSAFLEVLLLENFDSAYLQSVESKVRGYVSEYEELYQLCYDTIDEFANSSVESGFLRGFAGLSHAAASFLESTPLKDATPIDEALHSLGQAADNTANKKADSFMEELLDAMVDDITPYADYIGLLDSLHNEPQNLIIGEDAFYYLPAGETE